MTKKGWIIFTILCVSIIGAFIWIANKDKVDVSQVDLASIQKASAQNGNIAEHVQGKADSKVIIIEYGDFQCPGCGSVAPIVKQIAEKYKNQIGIVFRNYPLYSSHPNAFAASAVAEAAGLQGKYWEMHDKLYENQNSWKSLSGAQRTEYFTGLATEVGLDIEKFKTELDSPNIKKKIDYDLALGKEAGVTGTPSFFINNKNVGDKYYVGDKLVSSSDVADSKPVWSDFEAFTKLIIEPALKENNIPLPE